MIQSHSSCEECLAGAISNSSNPHTGTPFSGVRSHAAQGPFRCAFGSRLVIEQKLFGINECPKNVFVADAGIVFVPVEITHGNF